MNKEEKFSEEQVNAFIDGELEPDEKSRVFSAAEDDPELEQRLCQQRKLGELVRHAYQEVPEPTRSDAARRRRNPLARALVASVLILVGLGAGLWTHQYLDGERKAVALASLDSPNFILHISNGDPETLRETLQKARELLDSGDEQTPHRVEVVANEQGLNLLRSDITPYAGEVAELADKNVVFYACSRAIERLEQQGIEVRLVPQANPGYTALDRVVKRMQEDWNYIKI